MADVTTKDDGISPREYEISNYMLQADGWPGTSGVNSGSGERNGRYLIDPIDKLPRPGTVIPCDDVDALVRQAPSSRGVPLGQGGAPIRASILATDAAGRKAQPVASGVLDYFPDALVAVAEVSKRGNDQHNPGQPLFWARGKSTDESDTLIRHFLQRGMRDDDGLRHSAKMAWRALALLQKEIETEGHTSG